jgi:hypothetical protein
MQEETRQNSVRYLFLIKTRIEPLYSDNETMGLNQKQIGGDLKRGKTERKI